MLDPDEIFVFGSNARGKHGSGAARIALDHFGAVYGKGHGLHGQSYAIDTMTDESTMASEIWSASLSGCPMLTDSLVNR